MHDGRDLIVDCVRRIRNRNAGWGLLAAVAGAYVLAARLAAQDFLARTEATLAPARALARLGTRVAAEMNPWSDRVPRTLSESCAGRLTPVHDDELAAYFSPLDSDAFESDSYPRSYLSAPIGGRLAAVETGYAVQPVSAWWKDYLAMPPTHWRAYTAGRVAEIRTEVPAHTRYLIVNRVRVTPREGIVLQARVVDAASGATLCEGLLDVMSTVTRNGIPTNDPAVRAAQVAALRSSGAGLRVIFQGAPFEALCWTASPEFCGAMSERRRAYGY